MKLNWLGPVFGAGVRARNALYDRRLLSSRKLRGPVVSVGNLSVGGSGKTPFVILLGQLLKDRGVKFDVLSRGYGRTSKGVRLVDPNGPPQEFGDEPLLIARRLQAPVVVGEERYAAGLLAEEKFDPQLHLLDDGFQHRALARDFDIVLVTPEDARDRMLPAGRLREPLASLRRADAAVLMSGASEASFPLQAKLVWRVRRGITLPAVPQRVVAFCGIARPQNFFHQLRAAGLHPVAEAVYRDHHSYTANDVQELLKVRQETEAGGFVTTEKDVVNLAAHRAALEPLSIVPVNMKLENAADVVDTLLRAIEERRRGHEKILVTP